MYSRLLDHCLELNKSEANILQNIVTELVELSAKRKIRINETKSKLMKCSFSRTKDFPAEVKV